MVKYDSELIGLPGINYEFKCCHLPFLVSDDVFGALALEGSSGTGKTTIITRLGKLNEAITGGKVKTYSADKVRYEDFNGCPIPNNDTKKMDIYYMPNSISQMETVLIDEINRASYDNQEKFLSLLATREIDGIPSKCKYLFTAMNPILSEDNDVYEGVQPIDKALGERMIGLIKMTPFSKITGDIRIKIIQACFNQVNWTPSLEAVESFKQFVEDSKAVYEEAKYKYSTQVASYIDSIQLDLLKETKNIFKIEARRAQYIMVNILAMYALDSVFINSKQPLENSALAALLISFPNSLWEQPVNREALKQAHTRAKYILNENLNNKAYKVSRNILDKSLKEIENFVEKSNMDLPNKEQLSKLINQCIPDESLDPINHAIYCSGVVIGLTLDSEKGTKDQAVMKQQEFSRLETVYKNIKNSVEFKNLKEAIDHFSKKNAFPTNFKLPDFIYNDDDPQKAENYFAQTMQIDFPRLIMVICQKAKYELSTISELNELLSLLLDTLKIFKGVSDKYNSVK